MLGHTSRARKPREDTVVRMVRLPLFRVREGDDHYDRLLALERQRRGEFRERLDSGRSQV